MNYLKKNCEQCGNIIQYADDATFTITNKSRMRNQENLTINSSRLEHFLTTNGLTINLDKTKLLEIMIKQKKGRTKGEPPQLIVSDSSQQEVLIKDKAQCRILGINLQANLTWTNHLEVGPKAVLPTLRKNLGMVRNLGKKLPSGSRNTLARGMVLSRLNYLLGIWGGATNNMIRKAQILQNTAARWATNSSRKIKIKNLLNKAGWFSIIEMTKISTTTQMWKLVRNKTPRRMSEDISVDPASWKILTTEPRLMFSKQSFLYRASRDWNSLPSHIRSNSKLGSFKNQVKSWILEERNRPPEDRRPNEDTANPLNLANLGGS